MGEDVVPDWPDQRDETPVLQLLHLLGQQSSHDVVLPAVATSHFNAMPLSCCRQINPSSHHRQHTANTNMATAVLVVTGGAGGGVEGAGGPGQPQSNLGRGENVQEAVAVVRQTGTWPGRHRTTIAQLLSLNPSLGVFSSTTPPTHPPIVVLAKAI